MYGPYVASAPQPNMGRSCPTIILICGRHFECGHDMGNSVDSIRLRRRNHILPIYYANILPIYCPYCCKYMGHEIIFGRVSLSGDWYI